MVRINVTVIGVRLCFIKGEKATDVSLDWLKSEHRSVLYSRFVFWYVGATTFKVYATYYLFLLLLFV